MLHLRDSFYTPIEADILKFFWEALYAPIMALAEIPEPKLNAAYSPLYYAIRDGSIQYRDGVFSGRFTARTSRELASFAKFDHRTRTWRGIPGPAIKGISVVAQTKRKELQGRMSAALDDAEARINGAIRNLAFGMDLPLFAMGQDIAKDLYSVGVMPDLDARTMKTLRRDYTESQKLNIKNWSPEQIERLRKMVERVQTSGDNASLRNMIQSEWNTSAAKAKFLARQETSLFFSKLSLNRASATGVHKYRWSTSHDIRVRDSHKHLDGTIHAIDDPPIVDLKTGRRAHPGVDFNCRCAAIWILD